MDFQWTQKVALLNVRRNFIINQNSFPHEFAGYYGVRIDEHLLILTRQRCCSSGTAQGIKKI